MNGLRYLSVVQERLAWAAETQAKAISRAADAIAQAVIADHLLFAFGTGHSHMIAEELFARAGGMAAVYPILEPALMLHEGARKSSRLERLTGLADVLLDRTGVAAGDVVLIASHSGINAAPIEMAQGAKQRGAIVLAITSLAHSQAVQPRHPAGLRLYDVADVTLDNGGPVGDAAVEVAGTSIRVGPVSTVLGAALANAVIAEAAARMADLGYAPLIFRSFNLPDAEDANRGLIARYGRRIPLL